MTIDGFIKRYGTKAFALLVREYIARMAMIESDGYQTEADKALAREISVMVTELEAALVCHELLNRAR